MTDYEDILRQDATKRGWQIEIGKNRISLSEVPYRQEAGGTGRCQITVDTQDDGLTMITPAHVKTPVMPRRFRASVEGARIRPMVNPWGMSSGQTEQIGV